MKIQRLKEELRLERIRKYGKRSERLSDLQLELLGDEPAVSSEEIEAESKRDPTGDESQLTEFIGSTAGNAQPQDPSWPQ